MNPEEIVLKSTYTVSISIILSLWVIFLIQSFCNGEWNQILYQKTVRTTEWKVKLLFILQFICHLKFRILYIIYLKNQTHQTHQETGVRNFFSCIYNEIIGLVRSSVSNFLHNYAMSTFSRSVTNVMIHLQHWYSFSGTFKLLKTK